MPIRIDSESEDFVLLNLESLKVGFGAVVKDGTSVRHDWPNVGFVHLDFSVGWGRFVSFEDAIKCSHHIARFSDYFFDVGFEQQFLVKCETKIFDFFLPFKCLAVECRRIILQFVSSLNKAINSVFFEFSLIFQSRKNRETVLRAPERCFESFLA